jgi:hypothetical protein
MPKLMQDGKPLGLAIPVHWNPRHLLPPYAQCFAEELVKHARREFSGADHGGPALAAALFGLPLLFATLGAVPTVSARTVASYASIGIDPIVFPR